MNKLKEVRFFEGVSQPLLALKTAIQQSRISLIENELVTPREEEKKKIAEALEVKVRDIFPKEADDNNER
ncbi:MAG: helix-turn-helix transcriptional regulator [Deltaproteobacteria bacterium]|nr:helix-turn-helix transcriptional regulator [Deltaproteobacteria bacterium]